MTSTQSESLEVQCHECGQPIPTIPAWLVGAKVKFQCNECKEKHPRSAMELDAEPRRTRSTAAPRERPIDEVPLDDVEAEAEEMDRSDEAELSDGSEAEPAEEPEAE